MIQKKKNRSLKLDLRASLTRIVLVRRPFRVVLVERVATLLSDVYGPIVDVIYHGFVVYQVLEPVVQ